MATTVTGAFNEFMLNTVNLESDEARSARLSRNWLVDQILLFPAKDYTFPEIYSEQNIYFGSFARRTKKRPLDDIDIMICLRANGSKYYERYDKIEIEVPTTARILRNYLRDGTSYLNSRKLINAFVSMLTQVPQYKRSEVKRNQEAATLNLRSYDWTFDIVPCFFTVPDNYNRTYYLIPDGSGNWKKTDPRLDRQRVTELNTKHGGHLLDVIRATKFWNNRPTMPNIGSYLLENIILDYYTNTSRAATQFVDIELVQVFYYIYNNIYSSVSDPKNIQGNINNLTFEEKRKISERAYTDYLKASSARKYEQENKYKESIDLWQEVLGKEFPEYK